MCRRCDAAHCSKRRIGASVGDRRCTGYSWYSSGTLVGTHSLAHSPVCPSATPEAHPPCRQATRAAPRARALPPAAAAPPAAAQAASRRARPRAPSPCALRTAGPCATSSAQRPTRRTRAASGRSSCRAPAAHHDAHIAGRRGRAHGTAPARANAAARATLPMGAERESYVRRREAPTAHRERRTKLGRSTAHLRGAPPLARFERPRAVRPARDILPPAVTRTPLPPPPPLASLLALDRRRGCVASPQRPAAGIVHNADAEAAGERRCASVGAGAYADVDKP